MESEAGLLQRELRQGKFLIAEIGRDDDLIAA
jgi:hypothetical protein